MAENYETESNDEFAPDELGEKLEKVRLLIEQQQIQIGLKKSIIDIAQVNKGIEAALNVLKEDVARKKVKMFDTELEKKVQGFINCFRNEIGQYIQKDIGQIFNVVSFPSGVIVELEQAPNGKNLESFKGEVPTINDAFNALGKKLEDYLHNENNIAEHRKYFESNKRYREGVELYLGKSILIVAGKGDEFWTAEVAKATVDRIASEIEKTNKNFKPKP